MKTLFIILSLLITFSINVTTANALEDTKTRQLIDKPIQAGTTSGKTTNRLGNNADRLSDLKTRGDTEIQRRIEELNRLIVRINSFRKLSDAQKSNIVGQIQAQIDSLNSLKTKIDSDTDIDTLKTDIKSIVTDYRIYVFYIEYINIVAATERIDSTILNMTAVYDKLKTRIDNAESEGKDATRLKNLLSDMLAKINDAKKLNLDAKAQISGLNVAGYPDNKATLLDARTKLKSAYQDLRLAYTLGKQTIGQLLTLREKTESGTSSAIKRLLPDK